MTNTTTRTVYVVTWSANIVGGFEWRETQQEARDVAASMRDDTAVVRTVCVPATLDNVGVTEWLDDSGYSDGTTTDTHDVTVSDYGPCAASEAGEASVHAYEHACDCSEDYGPCELHCEVLAQREGASMRTADELAYMFVLDAQDCGVVLHRDDVTFLAEVAAALDGLTDRGSWIEDADLADQLRELVGSVEGLLPVGTLAYGDDGYRIVRVTGGPFA